MIHFLRNGPDLLEYENPPVTLLYISFVRVGWNTIQENEALMQDALFYTYVVMLFIFCRVDILSENPLKN